MKTYVLDILNRIRRKSEELDAKTILTNKAWKIFNDDGDEETIYFLENGKLRVSINGITTSGTWELFVEDKSVHIMYEGQKNGILLKPKFDANGILAMQLDGTNNYSFLIDKKSDNLNNIKTLSDLNNFYKQIEQAEEEKEKQKQLLIEARKAEEERERIRLEYERAEQAKQRKLEEKRLEEVRQKRLYIQKCKSERTYIVSKYSSVSNIFSTQNYSVEEVVNEVNKLGRDKKFLKFIKLKKEIPNYDKHEWDYYNYGMANVFFELFLCSLFPLFFCAVWLFPQLNIGRNYDPMLLLVLLVLVVIFLSVFIWILTGGIARIKKAIIGYKVSFLRKKAYKYEWTYEIVSQSEMLQTKDETIIRKQEGQIIDKYQEIVQRRQRIIGKSILELKTLL